MANGDQSYELPIPATYVVARDSIIQFAFVDADYTNRLDPEAIIAELIKTDEFVKSLAVANRAQRYQYVTGAIPVGGVFMPCF